MKLASLLFLLALCFKHNFADSVVQTRQGNVRGAEMMSRSGRKCWSFSGIPYAEPPVGPLRFRSPVAKKPWTETLDADKDGSQCVQMNGGISGSEDCLYLNVYTPTLHPVRPLPVMAYIHGGAYIFRNASRIFTGPGFLMDKDIVLVTFNSRLGIFGYLSTGDEAAPGNFGLKDEALALQWIQENIRGFGGNPNEVTLFGESSGAESVHMHALSSKSKKLFARAIMQSGIAVYPRAFAWEPSYYNNSQKVAKMFNCPTNNSSTMIDCLRKIEATKLVNTTSIFDELSLITHTEWRPTIEPESADAFITDTPSNLIRNKQMKNCPIITGNVKDEGTFYTIGLQHNEKLYQKFVNDPVAVIKRMLMYYEPLNGSDLTILATNIKNQYFGSVLPKDKGTVITQLTHLATDFFYYYPQAQFLNYLQWNTIDNVYSYVFRYHGALTRCLRLDGELQKTGIGHADDLFYIFPWTSQLIDGTPNNLQRTQTDYKIVTLMTDLWTSFANTSVPISGQLKYPDLWMPYRSIGYPKYLAIGNITDPTTTLQQVARRNRLNFWFNNVPQYSFNVLHHGIPGIIPYELGIPTMINETNLQGS